MSYAMRVMYGMLLATVLGLPGCGGSGGVASGNSSPGGLSVTQQNYETSINSGGYYSLSWNIPGSGVSPVSGTNYVYYNNTDPATSPTTGTQSYISLPTNLTTTLSAPNPAQTGIVRVVKNGVIYAGSSQDIINVHYSGDDVMFDHLASDGSTVMYSSIMDSCGAPIALTGAIRTTPEEVGAAAGLLTYYGDSNMDLSGTWQPGSSYTIRKFKAAADTLFTYDWSGNTYDNHVNSSNFSGTLESFFQGLPSGTVTIGPVQYTIGDGVISNVSGVRAWVASTPMPTSSHPSTSYSVLYEMGGYIYVGYLRKGGARTNQVSAIDGTVLLDYCVRFNNAAINSIKQTLRF